MELVFEILVEITLISNLYVMITDRKRIRELEAELKAATTKKRISSNGDYVGDLEEYVRKLEAENLTLQALVMNAKQVLPFELIDDSRPNYVNYTALEDEIAAFNEWKAEECEKVERLKSEHAKKEK